MTQAAENLVLQAAYGPSPSDLESTNSFLIGMSNFDVSILEGKSFESLGAVAFGQISVLEEARQT